MTQPKTQAEYNAKCIHNSRASGWGLETKQHFPCPGCAEPDWKVARIIDVETDLATDTTCQHCGRSFKVLMDRQNPNSLQFEFVQTGGDDLPEWYYPKMRRI